MFIFRSKKKMYKIDPRVLGRHSPRSEIVRDRRLSKVKDCPGSENVHYRRLSTVEDCLRALNEAVIGGCPNDLIIKNKKPFVWDKGSLGETPITSFHI